MVPIIVAPFDADFVKDTIDEFGIRQINCEPPARIIQRLDRDPVLVLPGAITVRTIPILQAL